MIIPVEILEVMIIISIGISAIAPIVLIILFIRDWLRGQLW